MRPPVAAGLNFTGHISITKAAGTFSAVVGGGSVNTLSANAAVLETSPGSVFGTHDSQPTLADKDPVNLANGGALNFTVNGQSFTVGLLSTDRIDDVITKLTNSALGAYLTFSKVTTAAGTITSRSTARTRRCRSPSTPTTHRRRSG